MEGSRPRGDGNLSSWENVLGARPVASGSPGWIPSGVALILQTYQVTPTAETFKNGPHTCGCNSCSLGGHVGDMFRSGFMAVLV